MQQEKEITEKSFLYLVITFSIVFLNFKEKLKKKLRLHSHHGLGHRKVNFLEKIFFLKRRRKSKWTGKASKTRFLTHCDDHGTQKRGLQKIKKKEKRQGVEP